MEWESLYGSYATITTCTRNVSRFHINSLLEASYEIPFYFEGCSDEYNTGPHSAPSLCNTRNAK